LPHLPSIHPSDKMSSNPPMFFFQHLYISGTFSASSNLRLGDLCNVLVYLCVPSGSLRRFKTDYSAVSVKLVALSCNYWISEKGASAG
jgi:hypothetical protein